VPRLSRRRVAWAAASLALAGLTLAGCSAIPGVTAPSPRTVSAAPTSTAPLEPVLSGVIATGTLSSPDGRTTGDLVLTATGDTVLAELRDFHTPAAGQIELHLSPHPADTRCAADSWSFVMNQTSDGSDTWALPISVPGGPFEVDPTYLRTVVVRADADAGKPNPDGCVYPPLATAQLDWKLAPTHTGLVVTDHGSRDQASGAVTTADGHPSTYTVAPGDTLEAIERRFRITADDLHYLNPFTGALTTPTLRYGTVLNLSRANRGAPPS